jgi:hypothetical protein
VKTRHIIIVSLLAGSFVLPASAYAERHAPKRTHQQTAAIKQVAKASNAVKERKPQSFQSIAAQYRGG